ncbi:hypothetical protein [Corynebacterium phocae]|uniref:hypothetical protein n=1 Tax=Corynebacterium phocae TaxID=161895 RepID=UPI001239CAE2|nr:hypothetical protein [Corynebacterium phocae]KAA8720638.1 hypothetical protein F4V58_11785 [Corynebacterium phocae]
MTSRKEAQGWKLDESGIALAVREAKESIEEGRRKHPSENFDEHEKSLPTYKKYLESIKRCAEGKPTLEEETALSSIDGSSNAGGTGLIVGGVVAAVLGLVAAALPMIAPMLPPQLRACQRNAAGLKAENF